jgi:hypothetical protein
VPHPTPFHSAKTFAKESQADPIQSNPPPIRICVLSRIVTPQSSECCTMDATTKERIMAKMDAGCIGE